MKASEHIFLSSSRLSHLVKERYGKSFSALQRQIKIEHASFLLCHYPDKTIKEIALETGFEDPHYFSRIFRQETVLSPIQYRNQQISPLQ